MRPEITVLLMIVWLGFVQEVTSAPLLRLSQFHAGLAPTILGKAQASPQTVWRAQPAVIAQSVELTIMENTGALPATTAQMSE